MPRKRSKKPEQLSTFAALFLAFGGIVYLAILFTLTIVGVKHLFGDLTSGMWFGLLAGEVASLYQIFVGLSLERPVPTTQRFAFHYCLFAFSIIGVLVGWSLWKAPQTGLFILLMSVPFLLFYAAGVWYFWQPEVRAYFASLPP